MAIKLFTKNGDNPIVGVLQVMSGVSLASSFDLDSSGLIADWEGETRVFDDETRDSKEPARYVDDCDNMHSIDQLYGIDSETGEHVDISGQYLREV